MPSQATRSSFSRLVPLMLLVGAMVVVFAMGWHRYLSLKTIGLNYESLKAHIGANIGLSLLVFVLLYVGVTALSLPGALVMTITGGLLFGWRLGAAATVVGATIGASIVFLIARSSLGNWLAAGSSVSLDRLRQGFRDNAFGYLLFLRLVPAFPFVVVNLAPALFGVRLGTFVAATFIGIIPATIAYSVAGSGLASVVEAQNQAYRECLSKHPIDGAAVCGYSIETGQIVTRELVIAFIALGLVALVPIVIKSWSKRDATVQS